MEQIVAIINRLDKRTDLIRNEYTSNTTKQKESIKDLTLTAGTHTEHIGVITRDIAELKKLLVSYHNRLTSLESEEGNENIGGGGGSGELHGVGPWQQHLGQHGGASSAAAAAADAAADARRAGGGGAAVRRVRRRGL